MATLAVGVTVRFCMVMYFEGELRLVDGISIAQWSFVSIGGLHTQPMFMYGESISHKIQVVHRYNMATLIRK